MILERNTEYQTTNENVSFVIRATPNDYKNWYIIELRHRYENRFSTQLMTANYTELLKLMGVKCSKTTKKAKSGEPVSDITK